jgi:hypothetical protein
MGLKVIIAASLTMMSIFCHLSRAALTAASISPGSPTSHFKKIALPPLAAISATV